MINDLLKLVEQVPYIYCSLVVTKRYCLNMSLYLRRFVGKQIRCNRIIPHPIGLSLGFVSRRLKCLIDLFKLRAFDRVVRKRW